MTPPEPPKNGKRKVPWRSGRPARRVRWYEVEQIRVKEVRPLVEVGQETVVIPAGVDQKPLELKLLWLERWGGTFGTQSSAEANSKRGRPSVERYLDLERKADGSAPPNPERMSDRGQKPAWLLYLACPRCTRRCRVLYSKPGEHNYGCPKCERPAARSNCWTPSGAGGEWQVRERQRLMHLDAAYRIRSTYLGDSGPRTGKLLVPARLTLKKPKGMTRERFEALARLVEAHETLAALAALGGAHKKLGRLLGEDLTPSPEDLEQRNRVMQHAQVVLRVDAWALRQRNWHRRGKPRDTPGQGTRARLARLEETSEDVAGSPSEGAA